MQPKAEAPYQPFDDEAPTLRRAKLADVTDDLEEEPADEILLEEDDDEPLTRSRRPPPLVRA